MEEIKKVKLKGKNNLGKNSNNKNRNKIISNNSKSKNAPKKNAKRAQQKVSTNKKKNNLKANKSSNTKNTNNNESLKTDKKDLEDVIIQDNIEKEKNNNDFKISKKKIIIPIIIFIFFVAIITSLIILYPKIKENKEINQYKKEVSNILKVYENKDIEDIKKIIENSFLNGEKSIIEEKVDLYLLNAIEYNKNLTNYFNDDRFKYPLNAKVLGNEIPLEYLNESLPKVEKIKDDFEIIQKEAFEYTIENEKLDELYHKLISEINDAVLIDDIDNKVNYINDIIPILNYLNENKDYYSTKEDKIEFTKRAKKEYYDNLISTINDENKSETTLIEDFTGPVITANDVTIYVGNKINIKDKIKCIDLVDDEVECIISGSYDSSKAGVYTITINSTDKSGNISSKNMKVNVIQKVTRVNTNNMPYYIEVIRNQNVVIVYGLDENKQYTRIVKVFVVSVGKNGNTPLGTFKTTKGYPWGALFGGVYGQYSTRIVGSYLFHSVPYYTKDKGNLEWQEYNKLGTAASAGCVRMTVRDVKWIYDNVATGTTVRIYDGNLPSGVAKPSAPKIPANSPNRGWDPTDPDPNNPWNK